MSIVKISISDSYTKIPNILVSNQDLSDKEFRLLCYLFSRPDDWQINNNDVMRRLKIKSPHTLAKCWKSLEAKGYLLRHRKEMKRGKFQGFDYELTLRCALSDQLPHVTKQHADRRHSESSTMEVNHNGTNDAHTNTDIYTNNNSNNKNERESEKLDFSRDFFLDENLENYNDEQERQEAEEELEGLISAILECWFHITKRKIKVNAKSNREYVRKLFLLPDTPHFWEIIGVIIMKNLDWNLDDNMVENIKVSTILKEENFKIYLMDYRYFRLNQHAKPEIFRLFDNLLYNLKLEVEAY